MCGCVADVQLKTALAHYKQAPRPLPENKSGGPIRVSRPPLTLAPTSMQPVVWLQSACSMPWNLPCVSNGVTNGVT